MAGFGLNAVLNLAHEKSVAWARDIYLHFFLLMWEKRVTPNRCEADFVCAHVCPLQVLLWFMCDECVNGILTQVRVCVFECYVGLTSQVMENLQ